MIWILYLTQVILGLLTFVRGQYYQNETELRANLSSGYNRFVRPSSTTNVTIFYNARTLQELDITEQVITLTGWITLYWDDPRFVWDTSGHNIEEIEVDWGWRPEFTVTNSASGFQRYGTKNDDTRIRAFNTGQVRWNEMLHTTTSCDVDISKFPFDTQTCEVEIIFWGYSLEELTVVNLYRELRKHVYQENAEWTFDSSSTDLDPVQLCCPTTVGDIFRMSVTFSRRRPFYVMNLIFPTILLSVCMVWAFMLPTESGERLGYSLTILLAYTVQLSITAQLMPTTSKQVPTIATYLLVVLVLCSSVTCNVVIHVKLFYVEDPVYSWVKAIYRKLYPIVFLTCCRKPKTKHTVNKIDVVLINALDRQKSNDSLRKEPLAEEHPTHEETGPETTSTKENITWAKVSILLDRILFLVYVIAVASVNGWFLCSIT